MSTTRNRRGHTSRGIRSQRFRLSSDNTAHAMNDRMRYVTYACGHTIAYSAYFPAPGDELICTRCEAATRVVKVDSRMLVVMCPECKSKPKRTSGIVSWHGLKAQLSAESAKARHNTKMQHHATVVTNGRVDEIPETLHLPEQKDGSNG
jgi:hypothetical protein